MQLSNGLLSYWFLPDLPTIQEALSAKEIIVGFIKLLRIPPVSLFIFTTIVSTLGTGFLATILEPYLAQVRLILLIKWIYLVYF